MSKDTVSVVVYLVSLLLFWGYVMDYIPFWLLVTVIVVMYVVNMSAWYFRNTQDTCSKDKE